MDFSYTTKRDTLPVIGMVILQADVRLETDLRRMIPPGTAHVHVTRIPSDVTVTTDTLSAMESALPNAAGLLVRTMTYDVIGYGCTSASAVIGRQRVSELISSAVETRAVTEPVSALLAACRKRNISRLAFLSPYVEPVSARLRDTLNEAGIATPAFGSFNEELEENVAMIDEASLVNAARKLVNAAPVEGLFMSCTNLNTLDVIPKLEAELELPVLSSNSVLGEHLLELAVGKRQSD